MADLAQELAALAAEMSKPGVGVKKLPPVVLGKDIYRQAQAAGIDMSRFVQHQEPPACLS